jgi:hypothetical protein
MRKFLHIPRVYDETENTLVWNYVTMQISILAFQLKFWLAIHDVELSANTVLRTFMELKVQPQGCSSWD